jgi:hypothetical protein
MSEIWERPPSTQKTSMTDPLGGDARDLRASTINEKILMVGPLGDGAEDPGAPTINVKKTSTVGPLGAVPEI